MFTIRACAIALVAALAGAASAAVVMQEGGGDPGMEKWMAAGKPGAPHALLAKLAGDWTTVTEMSMAPGAPPMQTAGTATYEAIFEGRFLTQRFKSDFMGMPFEGRGLMGYDNTSKEYHSHWIDSMGTMAMFSKGKAGDDAKVISVGGSYSDPMTGGTKEARNVITIVDDDSHTMEMFEKDAEGKEHRTIVIKYTRVKKD